MARGIAHRDWNINREDYDTDEDFRAAVQNELALAEHIGERLGVAIVAAPIRTRPIDGGSWHTAGWVFKTATVPAARGPEIEADDFEIPDLTPDGELIEDPALAE